MCDVDPSAAEAAALRHAVPQTYTDAAAMLDAERPDFVDIITRPGSHLALVRLAASKPRPGFRRAGDG